tara:strand:- start:97 stop:321 length:225 start_codon:yes stop_codon:yes gene_type:complete
MTILMTILTISKVKKKIKKRDKKKEKKKGAEAPQSSANGTRHFPLTYPSMPDIFRTYYSVRGQDNNVQSAARFY